jgi:hypothetical protein
MEEALMNGCCKGPGKHSLIGFALVRPSCEITARRCHLERKEHVFTRHFNLLEISSWTSELLEL